jgi:hypothetical protein
LRVFYFPQPEQALGGLAERNILLQMSPELQRAGPIYTTTLPITTERICMQQNIIEKFIADSRRYFGC